jgi:hypothetical protein
MEDVTQKVAATVHEARDKALRSLLNQCLGEEAWSMAEVSSKGSLRVIPEPSGMGWNGWGCLHSSTDLVVWDGKPLGFVFVTVNARGGKYKVESWISKAK